MTLEQQQVNVQELQRLHEAIAITMDAIRRVAPHLLQGQGYSPYSQAFGREAQPGAWQHLGQPLPWQTAFTPPQPWQQTIGQWPQQVGQWQQPYGYQPSPFTIGPQAFGGYSQPAFGGYGPQLDPVAQAYLHAHMLRNLQTSQQSLGGFVAQGTPGIYGQGTVSPWQQPVGSPFGTTTRPF